MTGVDSTGSVLFELLELLAKGAGSERIAQVTAQARGNRGDGAELDTVGHAGELALRIRRTLTEHERRETELTALFDTASDLAALRDPDAVLRSIVHRARTLLHADIAYLSMNDDASGGTYMRVTDGSVSALFQQVRLYMGEGLGGLVAQTARPYATAGYFQDERFLHTEPIDTAVREEGLDAILGVPLTVNGEVIGVLYAADRSTREFSPDEVALLSSLADHAAIAIDTANLLAETRKALAERDAANETIRGHNETLRRAEESHDRFTDLVLRGGDVPEVAAAVAEVLGGGIVVHDQDGGVLGSAGTAAVAPPADAVATSRTSGRAVARGESWVCAVLAGPELLGSIMLTGRADLSDADRRLFERAGVVTALLLLQRRSVAEAENAVRGELIGDLLAAPQRDPAGLVARGRKLGVDLTVEHAVLVADGGGAARGRLAAVAGHYARDRRGIAGADGDQLVLLLPGADPARAAAEVARTLGEVASSPVTVGAAGPAAEPLPLAAAHGEASRCLRALLQLGQRGRGCTLAELGFVGVLLGDRADTAGFVRATLGPVLDYDARRGTDLVATLGAYFDCGGSLARTKDVLHVHVNTVAQRLERITVLLGDGWQAPDSALEIQLALRLHRLTADN